MTLFFFLQLILLNFLCKFLFSQFYLKGVVYNVNKEPISSVNIHLKENYKIGTTTNNKGYFKLKVQENKEFFVVFSHVEYGDTTIILVPGKNHKIILQKKIYSLPEIQIIDIKKEKENFEKININQIENIPNVSGNVETIIKTLPGVAKTNELSYQYSVRGGSFDENLVYVNNIEIYRPLLIRSGQQEGLSFINPDLIENIYFSTGGFDASYGDKMSSVLDVYYKKPKKNSLKLNLSFLGSTLSTEYLNNKNNFYILFSFRHKTTKHILKSTDVKAQYYPEFYDSQIYMNYEVNTNTVISYLGNLSINRFVFIPISREASFGTIDKPFIVKFYFLGSEKDYYLSTNSYFTLTKKNKKNTFNYKFIFGHTYINEKEYFDIFGLYFLNEVEKQLSSSNFGDSIENIGIGTFLNHARNKLFSNIFNFQNIYEKKFSPEKKLKFGIQGTSEKINGKVHEWTLIDSAGYSLPYSDTIVNVFQLIYGKNIFNNQKISLFLLYDITDSLSQNEIQKNLGLRITYNSYTKELFYSPRLIIYFKPKDWSNQRIKFSTGVYYQPPSYKESLKVNGQLNKNIQSQKSIHFILGYEKYFFAWMRPFKLFVETYYKYYRNLISYYINNIRTIYSGQNDANGFAAGLDIKLNGEFIEGTESWFSLSFLKTMEKKTNNYSRYIPRPNDQLFNFSIFFQDYFPYDPTITFHLALFYGSGLPFGPPKKGFESRDFRMPPYRRVDIGFSKIFLDKKIKSSKSIKNIEHLSISLEVFNLLDISNTISYQWISDIYGNNYAVPNYLTNRRINLKLKIII